GTKAFSWEALAALEPDLIVANHEENKPDMWPRLEDLAPLWVAWPRTVDEALADLRHLAAVCGAAGAGEALAARVAAARGAARAAVRGRRFGYAYLVWRAPWMAVSDDTFIAALLAEVGGRNVFGGAAERYPSVTLEQLAEASPERVFLSSEPF